MYGVAKERLNGSCPVDRGRSEEVKAVRSLLRWVAAMPHMAMVACGSRLLPRPTSELMALLRSRSVLMSVAPDTTEG